MSPLDCLRRGSGAEAGDCDRLGEVEPVVHVELEPAVGVHVGPEQWGQSSPVGVGEPLLPLLLTQDVLEKRGVDVHQHGLKQVQGQMETTWDSLSEPVRSLSLP